MLKSIIWRATVVAMLAMIVAVPGTSLAEELRPRQAGAGQDSRPPRERPDRPVDARDVSRHEVRRCLEAVKEHGGSREDMRRCLAEAHGDEVARAELRRCIAAVKEHGGDRDDLRRCLATEHDTDQSSPTAGPTSILERVPDAPVQAPTPPSSILERVPDAPAQAPAPPTSILERVPEPVSP